MPIHDWTRVRANRFHHFHQDWTMEITRELNRGVLPPGYVAMAEQITGGPEPDVVTLSLPIAPRASISGGVAVADVPPRVHFRTQSDSVVYAARRIALWSATRTAT